MTGRVGFFSWELFQQIADQVQGFIKHTYLHLWGEPTLNPHLPEMIQRTKQFSTIDLATHGLSISDALADAIAQCDTISVSIDGITQDIYEKYRVGGQLKDAMHGLQMIHDRAVHSSLTWVFVVFQENEHQIDEARALAEQMGVKIHFKPSAIWDRTRIDSIPTDDKYRRYKFVDGEWQLKADRLKCREFWETVYVLPSGDVLTCCYDGAAKSIVGNVHQTPLLDIWNDQPYQTMRTRHEAGDLNEMCREYCQMMPT